MPLDPKTTIRFLWKDVYYIVSEAKNPILLPTGDVLSGDGWQYEIMPPNPGKLELLFEIKVQNLPHLKEVAQRLNGVVASPVTITTIYVCPNGHVDPTTPFCSQCGKPTEEQHTIIPYLPFPGYDDPILGIPKRE